MELASLEVVFWAKGAGRDQRPWDLNIGNAFLKDYILTLDYPRKRITRNPEGILAGFSLSGR